METDLLNAIIDVSTIIGPRVYYFYAEPNIRYHLSSKAATNIASYLIKAYLEGFLGYLYGRIKQQREKAAEQLWEAISERSSESEQGQREELANNVNDIQRAKSYFTRSEIKSSMALSEQTLCLILVQTGYPIEEAKNDTRRIVSIVERLPVFSTEISSDLSPMNILFLAANPINTQHIRMDEEIREIDRCLCMSELRNRFEIKQQWATRHTDLSQSLLRFKPHIVHFSGHGSKDGSIIVEDNQGKAHPVSPKALQELFRILKGSIRCVVLNACWTNAQAEAIALEIDCVVGMARNIGDRASIRFACGFYQALGFGKSVRDAFDLGCLEIDLANISDNDVPKLITRLGFDASKIIFE